MLTYLYFSWFFSYDLEDYEDKGGDKTYEKGTSLILSRLVNRK